MAQDWSVDASLSQRMTYNSNLLLNPNDKISTFGSVTTPELVIRRTTPTSSIRLDGRFPYNAFFGNSDLNSDNQLVSLTAQKQLSERSTLNLTGDFNRDSTVTSEEDSTQNFLNTAIRFIHWDVSPSWTYALSPIDRVTLGGSYQSVNYFNTTQRTDYRYYGTSLDYVHQLSELTSLTGEVSWYKFISDDTLNTSTDVYGALIGYQYTPSERFTVSGSVGLNYNMTHQNDIGHGTGDSNDLGYRLIFGSTYQINDQTQAILSLSHDTEPSGGARQVTRNRGKLTFTYQLSELTTFNLNANYADNANYFSFGATSGSQGAQEGNSRYFAIGPSVTWNLTEALKLDLSYQLRHKIFKNQGSTTDNAAFVTLRYNLPETHWTGF